MCCRFNGPEQEHRRTLAARTASAGLGATRATLLLLGCAGGKKHTPHQQLLEWKSEFIMGDGVMADGYHVDHDRFIKPYFTTDYRTDTLIVTTLIETNACSEIVADIALSNDTLFLLTRDIGEEACTSVQFNKFTYVVRNPDNRRFVIVSEE